MVAFSPPPAVSAVLVSAVVAAAAAVVCELEESLLSLPQAASARPATAPNAANVLIFTWIRPPLDETVGGPPETVVLLYEPGPPGPPAEVASRDPELLVEHQHGSAEEHVVVAERAGADGDVVADGRHRPASDGGEGRLEQRWADDVGGSGDHDIVKVQHAHDRGQRESQAPTGGLDHVGLGAGGRGGAEAGAEQGGGDHCLEAAALPAGALFAPLVDHDVADLTGRRVIADDHPAVDEQAAAHAAADLDEQEVGRAAGPEGELAERSRVGVV